jgi:gamma-glutamylcyclotransferase (GGCT)/AIG2-like uncharacterized protein YtfP
MPGQPSLVRVFVYGTLKPGYAPHQLFCAAAVSMAAAIVYGQLYHLPLGYPALIVGGNQPVYGYMLTFATAEVLAVLDEYEQHDPAQLAAYLPEAELASCNYQRQWVDLLDGQQQPLAPAWAYVMTLAQVDRLQGQLIADGVWRA